MREANWYRPARLQDTLSAIALSVGIWSVPAAGQTRFAWSDTAIALARYETVEECLAATERVASRIAERERRVVWRDTMPWNPAEVRAPLPAPVVETARRCGARFATIQSGSLDDFALLLRLYVEASWDEKSDSLVTRRLGTLAPNASRERDGVIDTAAQVYLNAQPKRLALAARILGERLRPTADPVARLRARHVLMNAASRAGDTAEYRRAIEHFLESVDALTTSDLQRVERETPNFLLQPTLLALAGRSHREMLDSLRHSTKLFLAMKLAQQERVSQLLARATGHPRPAATRLPPPVGDRAPQLEANFWFGGVEATRTRPTRGRTALVVFLDHASCDVGPDHDALLVKYGCRILPAILRRLAARFPALEITLVGQTSGYFMYLPPVVPVDEGKLVERWWAALQVPGAYASATTEFWRLPDPDRRRIDREVGNVAVYNRRDVRTMGFRFGSAFLVDANGIIVHTDELWRENEPEFAELIEALVQRDTARSGS